METAVVSSNGTNEQDDSRRSAICKTVRNVWRSVNVEPVILLTMIGYGQLTAMQPVFLLWARCVQLYVDQSNVTNGNVTEFCSTVSKNSTYQDVIEGDVASWSIYIKIGASLPTLIVSPFMGAWSDGTGGRKKPLFVAFAGLLLYGCMQVCCTLIYKSMPIYPLMLAAEICFGLTGGLMTIFATTFSIVTDDSRAQMHKGNSDVPYRMAFAAAMQPVGLFLGGLFASLCVKFIAGDLAYACGEAMGVSLLFFAFLYAVLAVRETHEPKALLAEADEITTGYIGFFALIKRKAYDLVEVVVVKREGWTRFCLCVSVLFVFVEIFASDNGVLLLIVKRQPLEWTDAEWINFSNFKLFTYTLGMVACPLLIARTNWLGKDSLLILFGIFSAATVSILFSFATSTVLLYICGTLCFFTGPISPGFRTFLPRMVRKDETARLMTLFGIVISLTPILAALTFNSIFKATMGTWPGCAYFVSGLIQFLVLAGQFSLHLLLRPLWKRQVTDGAFKPLSDDFAEEESDSDEPNDEGLATSINA